MDPPMPWRLLGPEYGPLLHVGPLTLLPCRIKVGLEIEALIFQMIYGGEERLPE